MSAAFDKMWDEGNVLDSGNTFDKMWDEEVIAPELTKFQKAFRPDPEMARKVAQVPLGVAKKATWPANLIKALIKPGAQQVLAELEEDTPLQQALFGAENIPSRLTEEQRNIFNQTVLKGAKAVPTQESLEQFLEDKLGLPLRPQTRVDELLRLGGEAGAFRGGQAPVRAKAGVVAPVLSSVLNSLGIPKEISDTIGLVLSGGVPEGGAKKAPMIKESGLPKRRFEALEKDVSVTEPQAAMVRKTVEADVKGAVEDLVKKESKVAKYRSANPEFDANIDKAFDKVEALVEKLPKKELYADDLTPYIRRQMKQKASEGITKTSRQKEYEKTLMGKMKELRGAKATTPKKFLQEYRLTNKELKEYFEPGKSRGTNIGKKEALIDYNKSISELFKREYPKSEFNELFSFTNNVYRERADISKIENFLENTFKPEQIDFKNANKALRSKEMVQTFERVLGQKSYNEFQKLMKDFQGLEKPLKLMKATKPEGFNALTKHLSKWYVFKPWAKGSAVTSMLEHLRNGKLADPVFIKTWEEGIKAVKQGKAQKANAAFSRLDRLEKEES